MYRKTKRESVGGILNLDSLMDILSCLVGVMLFMVMYTVLELGSTAYQVNMPGAGEEPVASRQVVVFCTGGTVRVLDARTSVPLVRGLPNVSFADVPAFVESANEGSMEDDFFRYSLGFEERVDAMGARSRVIMLEVEELPGIVGDSVGQLGEGSRYADFVSRLNPASTWMEFVVDSSSLDVFRQARALAIDRRIPTGWSPLHGDFPLAYPLSVAGRLRLGPEAVLSKPQR